MNIKPSVPEWIPDWRDASQYPDPAEAPHNQWQWEFVRRNAGYQADFDKARETKDYREVMNKYCVNYPLFDPSKSRYKYVEKMRDGTTEPREFRTEQAVVTSGGLEAIKKLLNGEGANVHKHERMFADPHRYQVLIIDNMKPLEPQMKCMLKMFELHQKSYLGGQGKQASPEDYLRYLRSYDALSSGASEIDVAVELHGKDPEREDPDAIKSDVRKDANKALELIYGGYLRINPDYLV